MPHANLREVPMRKSSPKLKERTEVVVLALSSTMCMNSAANSSSIYFGKLIGSIVRSLRKKSFKGSLNAS